MLRAASIVACLSAIAGAPSALGAAPDVTGEWSLTVDIAGQPVEYRLELKQKDEAIEGALISPRSGRRYPLKDASLRDSTLRADLPRNLEGREVVLKIVAKLSGDQGEKLEGTVEAEGIGPGKFVARRKGAPPAARKRPVLPGKWKSVALLPQDRQVESTLELIEREGKLSGAAVGDRGSVDFKSIIQAEDGSVTFTFLLPGNAGDTEYLIRAAFEGPDVLKGRWSRADGGVSGDWSARRESPAPAGPSLKPRYRLEVLLPDGQSFQEDLFLKVAEGKVSGRIVLPDGKRLEIASGTFRGVKLEFEVKLEDEAKNTILTKVTGTLGAQGLLEGTWKAGDASGEWRGRPVEEL